MASSPSSAFLGQHDLFHPIDLRIDRNIFVVVMILHSYNADVG
jgi:hypothetical protein